MSQHISKDYNRADTYPDETAIFPLRIMDKSPNRFWTIVVIIGCITKKRQRYTHPSNI